MNADGLVTIYRAADPSLAAWLCDLLEERGIPTHRMASGPDGFPAIYFGTVDTKVMVLRSDLEAHRDEIEEAVREVEQELGGA
jgi:hypothetical protein